MATNKIWQVIALSLVSVLLYGYVSPSGAQSDSALILDADKIRWSHLELGAKSVWVDVNVNVRLESQSRSKMQGELLENRKGDAIPVPESGGFKLTTDILSDAAFKPPVHKKNRVWFIPHDGTALGRFRLRRGKEDFKKVYRFTRQGVFRYRQEPKNRQETSLNPEQWTDTNDTFYEYRPAQLGCAGITDRLLLIYIAAAAGMSERKQPLSVCVFGKRALFQVKLQPAGMESIRADFVEMKQQTETHREGNIQAFKINLEARLLEYNSGFDENFSFLGLRKNISIHIEPETGLPIQISGDTPSSSKRAVLSLQKAKIE